jgi:hypothetical protein
MLCLHRATIAPRFVLVNRRAKEGGIHHESERATGQIRIVYHGCCKAIVPFEAVIQMGWDLAEDLRRARCTVTDGH